MRSFGFRLTLLAAILAAGIDSTAWALGHHGTPVETVYVMPSSVTLPVPTSYVVSTSWVQPTAYAVPTYYTTAYWMDPVVLAQPTYATTAYVRRGLFGRLRVVERPVLATYATSYVPTVYATSYVPTTYYAPTVYRSTSYSVVDPVVVPSSYLASSDCVCPSSVASAAPTYVAPSRDAGTTTSGNGSRSRGVTSQPEDRESMDSSVDTEASQLDAINRRGTTGGANNANNAQGGNASGGAGNTNQGAGNTNQGGGIGTPGRAVTPNPNATGGAAGGGNVGTPAQGNQQQGAASTPSTVTPPPAPPAPADDNLGTPPPINRPTGYRRDSYRPTYASRPVPSEFRNVLVGKVLSRSAGEPEEGVRIRVRNAETGASKSTTTDAFGRFAVRLNEGDWAVDVTMPSGRVYEVSRLRVDGGLITDDLGRRVPVLDITR